MADSERTCAPHAFEPVTFRMPSRCAICSKHIGVFKNGYRCTHCRECVHKKCQEDAGGVGAGGGSDGGSRTPLSTSGTERRGSLPSSDGGGGAAAAAAAAAAATTPDGAAPRRAPLTGDAKRLWRAIEKGDAAALDGIKELPTLLETQLGEDLIPPLIKMLQDYSSARRADNKLAVFRRLLSLASTTAVNLPDGRSQWTPLMWALSNAFAFTDMLDQLLARDDLDVRRALAVFCGTYHRADYKRYFEWLVQHGADVQEGYSQRNSPLHKACQNHSIGGLLVRALIKHGADLNAVNARGMTALFEAVLRSRPEIVRTLVNAGADVTVADDAGRTPRDYAQDDAITATLRTAEERVRDIAAWLEELGMSRYLPLFLKHHVYHDVVGLLSEERLVQMGVDTVGDRLRLLNGNKLIQTSDKYNSLRGDGDGGLGGGLGGGGAAGGGPSRRRGRVEQPRAKDPAKSAVLTRAISDALLHHDNPRSMKDVVLDYREIQIFEELGRGTFGTVFRGAHRATPIAVKVLDERHDPNEQDKLVSEFTKQFAVWSRLKDENVIYLHGVCVEPLVALVMDLTARGNLRVVMQTEQYDITWRVALSWFQQIARGMLYLHSFTPPILHRDLKPANILVDDAWVLKVADFDTARFGDDNASLEGRLVGSPSYIAPELFNGDKFDERSDVYSIGVICNELVVRAIAGVHESPYADQELPPTRLGALIIAARKGARPSVHAKCPDAVRALIVDAWNKERDARPTCQQLLTRCDDVLEQFSAHRDAWEALRDTSRVTADGDAPDAAAAASTTSASTSTS